jgi:predicted CXXCH cytochrome family protein
MNIVRYRSLKVVIFLVAGISALLVYSYVALAQAKVVLSTKDCSKCHADRANDIAVAGGGHRSVSCLGCHAGHPPEVKKPFAPCNTCHQRPKDNHPQAGSCLGCHTNPHRPLNILLKGANKEVCLTCHGPESWQLRTYESKHTALDCSQCHDVHRKIPQCTQCHIPHKGRIVGDCKQCHRAHTPKMAAFPENMPSTDCGSCHKIPSDLLRATASKHKSLTCVGCHKLKHRFKPACQDCHGTPHPEGILAKFPECTMCHNSPHDLNNWPETATAVAAGVAPKKQ